MLQRIVKALPYKLLLVQKDSRPFWCFVFLSRCLIYKVHAAKLTAGFQCTTFRSPCQELFQVFQTFFKFFRPLTWQEKTVSLDWPFMLALPIFPARLQASIFGRSELNFRVRNGNGWTLALINTNFNFLYSKFKHKCLNFEWWPVRESNPCLRRERPPS